MTTINVTIYIKPNKQIEYSEILDKVNREFQDNEHTFETYDDVMMFHYKIDITDNKYKFEDYLDYLCSDYKYLRYIIKIYEPNKKYPESARINKQFKKIKTKQQTKYMGF
jgi:hypothetical protein